MQLARWQDLARTSVPAHPKGSSVPGARTAPPLSLVFALASLIIASPLPAPAHTGQSKPAKKSAALIVDANTARTLHAANADALRYPASLTKMMTLYLAFEAIERGKASFRTKIRFSKRAAAAPPSKIGLKPGQTIRLKQAIKALIVKSANDVAVAVAEHFAGSEARFAHQMTAKARQLGMTSTVFRNASGLPNSKQVTTARDMVRLALHIQDDFPQYYPLFKTRSFVLRGKRYRTHNALLKRFKGTDGMKTGYTRASGFNVVTSVRRGRRHLVGAVFGSRTSAARDRRMRTLITKSLIHASTVRTRKSGPQLIARPRLIKQPQPKPRSRITLVNVRSIPVTRQPQTTLAPSPKRDHLSRPYIAQNRVWRTPEPGRTRHPSSNASRTIPVIRGRPPSTLNNQARRLAAINSQRAHQRMQVGAQINTTSGVATHPQSSPIHHLRGTHEIQIGAFRSPHEARAAIIATRSKAPKLLHGYSEKTLKYAARRGQTLYRSRFAGFTADTASSICLELRRRAVDCFVARSR